MDPSSHAGLQVHLQCPDHCAADCTDRPVVFLTVGEKNKPCFKNMSNKQLQPTVKRTEGEILKGIKQIHNSDLLIGACAVSGGLGGKKTVIRLNSS